MKRMICTVLAVASLTACAQQQQTPHHYITVGSKQELFDFFRYSPDRDVIISGHRGGMMPGYPENSIESFEKTLTYIESFFEIDPRFTKDSVIVLMHDRTIDRTTTGKGLLSDYDYAELSGFNLVDREGNTTPYKIPTLRECIEWSRGKTILNFDIKDVPLEFMSDFIASIEPAPQNIMYTVHNPDHVRRYLEKNPDAMFSAHCKNMEEFAAYDEAGMPWGQVMAYVGPRMLPENAVLYRALHSRGVMCMISVAPTHDKAENGDAKVEGYKKEIAAAPDVIETDFPCFFTGLDLSKTGEAVWK